MSVTRKADGKFGSPWIPLDASRHPKSGGSVPVGRRNHRVASGKLDTSRADPQKGSLRGVCARCPRPPLTVLDPTHPLRAF